MVFCLDRDSEVRETMFGLSVKDVCGDDESALGMDFKLVEARLLSQSDEGVCETTVVSCVVVRGSYLVLWR